MHQQEKLSGAERSYKTAIKLNPNFGEAHNNLGNVLLDRGKYKQAEHSYKETLRIFPDHPMVLSNIGNALQLQGQHEEAIDWLYKAISVDESFADAYSNLGNALQGLERLDEAVASYKKAITLKPAMSEAYLNLGIVQKDLGKLDEALVSHEKVIKLKPGLAEPHFYRAIILHELGQFSAAVYSYDEAIKLQLNSPDMWSNRGVALTKLGRLDEAIESYNRAIELKPDYVEAYSNKGVALKDLGRLDEAIESYDRAIQFKPNVAETFNNRGNAQKEAGKVADALISFKEAIRLKADYAEAHWNLSLTLLLSGNFREGWREYEYGKLIKNTNRRVTQAKYSYWEGSSLIGKTILITAEQGVGDEVMFASCLPDLLRIGSNRIIFECDPRLVPLFARSFPQVETIHRKEREAVDWISEIGNIDFQISAGSLPKLLRQSASDFPEEKSYLRPDAALRAKWENRYEELGEGLKIGISWSGGGNETLKNIRSIDLQLWEPILQSGAHFIDLQYGDHSEQTNQLEKKTGMRVHQWNDVNPLVNLDDFIAQIGALDLVISIDNSTVHFSGAVGTAVWVLLPFVPNYRWMLASNNTPWYPTMRLFRQTERGDWGSVIDEVSQSLTKYAPA